MRPQEPGGSRYLKTRGPTGVASPATSCKPPMSNEAAVLTDRIGYAHCGQVSLAKSRLTLAAPFIKRNALERLLGGLRAAAELTVITRWMADEIIAGVTDLGVFDLVRDRGRARLLL